MLGRLPHAVGSREPRAVRSLRHAAFEGPGAGGFDFSAGFEDIFSGIFGDFFGQSRGRGRGRARRGEDLRYNLDLSVRRGGVRRREDDLGAAHGRRATHATARAAGRAPQPKTCQTCRGSGQVRFQQGFFSIAKTCAQCSGQGSDHHRSVLQVSGPGRRAEDAEPEREDSGRRRHRLAAEAPRRGRGGAGRRRGRAISTS